MNQPVVVDCVRTAIGRAHKDKGIFREVRSDDLAVAVECIFTWYWLADLCAREKIDFVLGHALYMKAIHGTKAKSDREDAYRIARLVRGGNFPVAYTYPAAWPPARRRRLHELLPARRPNEDVGRQADRRDLGKEDGQRAPDVGLLRGGAAARARERRGQGAP